MSDKVLNVSCIVPHKGMSEGNVCVRVRACVENKFFVLLFYSISVLFFFPGKFAGEEGAKLEQFK